MNALALVQEAVERFVPIDGHLDKISMSLEELHDFVYIWGIDRNQISKVYLVKWDASLENLPGGDVVRITHGAE